MAQLTVVCRSPMSQTFILGEPNDPKSRRVTIYGYTSHYAPEECLLINGGTARITKIEEADWEAVVKKYAYMTELWNQVIFAMPKEIEAKAKAKELINNLEHLPVRQIKEGDIVTDELI